MANLGASFADRIVPDLLCPGCSGFLLPPIVQCVNGHCMCSECRQILGRCKECQGSFTNVRCRPLETLAEHYHVPCINNCGEKIRLVNLVNHESNCAYRKFSCKIGQCTWKGKVAELASHVSQKHPMETFSLGEGNFSRQWSGHYIKLAVLDSKTMFWYHLIQDPGKRKYFRAFQYIGPSANASKFRYYFFFHLPDNPSDLVFSRPPYTLYDDVNAEYEKDEDFLNIITHTIKRYQNAPKFPVSSTIRRSSSTVVI